MDTTPQKYRTIVADPPWPYDTRSNPWIEASPTHRPKSWDSPLSGPFTANRYDSITMDDLLALRPPADDASHLYLWTTNAFMEQAHAVARAWGFKPKTICTWTKVTPDGRPSMKTGYYFRGATEHWLFCVRGSLRLLRADLSTAYLWPRLPHSVKPDAFYDLVESASPGPYLELFARRQRLGWDTWGDECRCDVEMAAT